MRIFLSHACSNQIHPRRPLASPLTFFLKNVSSNDYFLGNSCLAISQTNITRASKLFLFSSIYLTFLPPAAREFSNSSRSLPQKLTQVRISYLLNFLSQLQLIANCKKHFNIPPSVSGNLRFQTCIKELQGMYKQKITIVRHPYIKQLIFQLPFNHLHPPNK